VSHQVHVGPQKVAEHVVFDVRPAQLHKLRDPLVANRPGVSGQVLHRSLQLHRLVQESGMLGVKGSYGLLQVKALPPVQAAIEDVPDG
jgi:hypothetical protein